MTQTANKQSGSELYSSIQVVHRSLRVLETLAGAETPLSLTTVAERVSLHRSTTLRILRTLAEDGYAAFQAKTKSWTVGPAVLRLQAGARASTDLRQVARPVMQALSHAVGETVQLATMVDAEVCYLDKVEPPDQEIRVLSEVGSRRPLYCTALGKALLAGLDEQTLAQTVAGLRFERHTDETITDPETLIREVAEARRRGYSLDRREYNRAIQCSAAPIRDANGAIIAAISVSTIGLDIASETFADIIAHNLAAAHEISHAMGWRAPLPPSA
ncbi:MAG: IclR family transcriptional regulator [Nitratireductor sp.]